MASKAARFARKQLNVYMRRLKKWSDYYTPERKNTPAELRLWHALHRALDRVPLEKGGIRG